MQALLFFEDIDPGTRSVGPEITVDKTEMVEFAKIWDPIPIHVDEDVAQRTIGGLTAPGLFILALKQRLIHAHGSRAAVIGSMGYDEVRFFRPVRPGDQLRLAIDWVEKRESKSRTDRGVVVHRLSLINAEDETVMSHLDTLMVKRRRPRT